MQPATRPGRLDVLARYGSDRLRRMTVELHTRFRGLGLPLDLVAYRPPDLPRAIDEARVAALAAGDDPNAQALLAVLERDLDPAELEDLSEHGVDAKAPLKEAVEAVQEAAQDVAADADRVLLEELLREFDASYSEIKNGRGLLDFNDLELEARALLQSRPEVAQECRERFVEVMVDEFQDTNALQVELVELVRGGDLFLVGDEFQSIYRFRRADVNVYRERRAQAGDELVALTENYRSAPHILDLVNETFTRESGSAYTDLVAANGAEPDPGLPSVELLLTDIRACKEEELIWRTAEAESIAERVAELVGQGHCGYGDVVLLFEAGTDAGIYEGELRKLGIPTVRATGRGYYGQQEVGDILQYLRLLLNRTDDRALLSVLASPLVGLSPDGLALLRLATRRAAAIGAFEPGRWPQDYSESDNRLAQAFRLRFERLVDQHTSLSLEQLCERVVAEHDFDLALLARPDGDRRLANVRKLIRLAREYEQLRGPDLDGFVRFCEEQADLASREGDAAIADEGGDAVMLMTVHAAKGLEFEVVVIADAGRRPGGALERRRGRLPRPGRVSRRSRHRHQPAGAGAEGAPGRRGAGGRRGGQAQAVRGDDPRAPPPDHQRRHRPANRQHADRGPLPDPRHRASLGGRRRPGENVRGGQDRAPLRGAGARGVRVRPAAPVRGVSRDAARPAAVRAGRPAACTRRPPDVLQRTGAVRPLRLPVLRPAAAPPAGARAGARARAGDGRRRGR